jgi:hypothetical protein
VGALTYDEERIDLDDRLLVHLQVVIVRKFRRGESFSMSWVRSVEIGSGRCSIWMVPTIPIRFEFRGSRVPPINQQWLERMTESAGSARGLLITNEDGTLAQQGPPDPLAGPRRRQAA